MAVSMSTIKTRSAGELSKYYEKKAAEEVEEMIASGAGKNRSEEDLYVQARENQIRTEARLFGEDPEAAVKEARAEWSRQKTAGQTAYYAADQGTDRSVWLKGDQAGHQVTVDQLEDLFLGNQDGQRSDDPQIGQLNALAKTTGYTGELTREVVTHLRAGQDPQTGQPLQGEAATQHQKIYQSQDRNEGDVNAYDITFSTPKGVSLIAAFGSEQTREAIVKAQHEAVEHALEFAESNEMITVRRGKQGAQRQSAQLQQAAVKTEFTSREGDPDLHTHTLVSAYVEGEDGRITAMDGQVLMGASATLNDVYLRALSQQLEESLGFSLQEREIAGKTRLAAVPGISQDLETQYSTRRQQINQALDERLREKDRLEAVMGTKQSLYQNAYEAMQAGDPQNAQQLQRAKVYQDWLDAGTDQQSAALSTRSSKADESEQEATTRWAQEQTPDGDQLLEAAQKHSPTISPQADQELDVEMLHDRMDNELVTQADKFNAAEALSAAYRLAPQHADDNQVMAAARQYLSNAAVELDNAPQMGRTGDIWASKQKGWTTHEVVKQRQHITETARVLAGQRIDRQVDPETADQIARNLTLSGEQEQMLTRMASGARLITVQGLAGTGKSHADKALVRAIQESGGEVTIMSTKADLAAGLAAETGANRGMTLAGAATKNGVFATDTWAQGLSDEQISTFHRLDDAISAARTNGDQHAQEQAEEKLRQWSASLPTAKDAQATAASRHRVETLDKAAKFAKQAGVPGAAGSREMLHHQREKLAHERDQQPDVKTSMDKDTTHTVIVDEAAMSSDEHMEQLLDWAKERPNVQIILQGDFAQLGAVDRSGAFRQILDHVDPVDLREIRRANHQWEREAQTRMHDLEWTNSEHTHQQAADIIDTYSAHDRIHSAGSEEQITEAIQDGTVEAKDRRPEQQIAADQAAQWYLDHQDEDAAVLVPTKHMQTQIAEQVQQQRKQLPEDHPHRLDPQASTAQLNLGDDDNPLHQQVQAGEKVTIRQNMHSQGLRNGQAGEVKSVRKDGSILVNIEDERGRQFNVRLTKDQLDEGAAALAYTSTVHKAQGLTLDRGLYVHDPASSTVDRHLVYPAMTRGKEANEVLIIGDKNTGTNDLARAMSYSDQDTLRVASHRVRNPEPDEQQIQDDMADLARDGIEVSEETARTQSRHTQQHQAAKDRQTLIESEQKKLLTPERQAILKRRKIRALRSETTVQKVRRQQLQARAKELEKQVMKM